MSKAAEILDSYLWLSLQEDAIKGYIVEAMEEYALACLEKAAENAALLEKDHPGEWGEEIDKASITSKDNLV